MSVSGKPAAVARKRPQGQPRRFAAATFAALLAACAVALVFRDGHCAGFGKPWKFATATEVVRPAPGKKTGDKGGGGGEVGVGGGGGGLATAWGQQDSARQKDKEMKIAVTDDDQERGVDMDHHDGFEGEKKSEGGGGTDRERSQIPNIHGDAAGEEHMEENEVKSRKNRSPGLSEDTEISSEGDGAVDTPKPAGRDSIFQGTSIDMGPTDDDNSGSLKTDVRKDETQAGVRDESVIKPSVLGGGIDRLKALSRRLRGGVVDPIEVLPEVQDVIESQLNGLQSMQQMFDDGDVASGTAIKSFIDDMGRELQHEISMEAPKNNLSLDNVDEDWDNIPDSQLSQLVDILRPELSYAVEQMKEVNEALKNAKSTLEPFGNFKFDSHPFEQGTKGGHSQFRPRSFPGNIDDILRQAKTGTRRSRLPNLSKFIPTTGDDDDAKIRRLKVKKRHERRLDALEVCGVGCNPDDQDCRCKRLASCVSKMTHYDISLMFVSGYVETDPSDDDFAKFTVDETELNLFDADFDIYDKATSIQDAAKNIHNNNTEGCSDLLAELHASCDPLSDELCSDENIRSFPLSVEEVCNAVDTPTKLSFALISSELDGYASDDGGQAYFSTCGAKRVAFESCKDFAKYFELLYDGRDKAEYPYENPMRQDLNIPVGDGDTGAINFPTSYKFDRSLHGVATLAFPGISASTTHQVVLADEHKNLCMMSHFDGNVYNVKMADCQEGNTNQIFEYDASTHQIKQLQEGTTLCLDYVMSTDAALWRVYLFKNCNSGLTQKWRNDFSTNALKTFHDNVKCLDMIGDTNRLIYMNDCTGSTNQQFKFPSQWMPGISIGTLHQVRASTKLNRCMTSHFDGNVYSVKMADCQDGNTNQILVYDASTQQIKQTQEGTTLCLDYVYSTDATAWRVYLFENCHSGLTQKWRHDVTTKVLKTFHDDDKCLDKTGGTLYMKDCADDAENQQFQVPSQWKPAISITSSYSRVMNFYNGMRRCMGSPDSEQMSMVACDKTNTKQDYHYDASTRTIKYGNGCLDMSTDYVAEGRRVYMNTKNCHGKLNQQWYYNPMNRTLQNLEDSRCLDMALDDSDTHSKWQLYMYDCHGRHNQQFWIPLLWTPSSYLDEVRVFQNRSLCMAENPEYNNNGNTSQDFHYDSATYQIKHVGLCLEHNADSTANDNVFMNECSAAANQKWLYDGHNRLKTENSTVSCLEFDPDNENNLYMSTCAIGDDHQKFLVPTTWSIRSSSSEDPQEHELYHEFHTYKMQPIPTSLWNGEWDDEKGKCSIDMLEDVIDVCDETMKLLLGHATSLGTLQDIAKQVNDVTKGPDYMPGKCCTDNAMNSQWFGFRYNPGVSYSGGSTQNCPAESNECGPNKPCASAQECCSERGYCGASIDHCGECCQNGACLSSPQPMKCQNPGPWNLGISAEACENAGGRWVRSPCAGLKDCIDARPKPGEDGFSQSFEDFASGLVIFDASDEDECRRARQGLGFESDYPYDTEVCSEFSEYMCDAFFTEVDGLVVDVNLSYSTIKYSDPYNAPDLSFKPLPKHSGFEEPDNIGDHTDMLKNLKISKIALQDTAKVARRTYDVTSKNKLCDYEPAALVALGTSVVNAANILCVTRQIWAQGISFWIMVVADVAYMSVYSVFQNQKLGGGAVWDDHYYIESIFDNLKTLDDWNYKALDIINTNINVQHTEVRDQLQDQHAHLEAQLTDQHAAISDELEQYICETVNGMGATCVPLDQPFGRHLEGKHKNDFTPRVAIQWPDTTTNLWEQLGQVGKQVNEILTLVRNETVEAKSAKSDKAHVHLEMDDESQAMKAIKDVVEIKSKMGTVEERMGSVEERMGSVEDKISALESTVERKVDALSSMLAELIDLNNKLLEKQQPRDE